MGIMNKIVPILATILAVVAMGAATIAIIAPMAYAQGSSSTTTFSFSQSGSNNCSGFTSCLNNGTITFRVGG
jgi:hypothetical protein